MEKRRASYIEGSISIVANIALFGLKFWAGIVSGSIALIADAWHTLSDSVSSVIVIVGAKLSAKKPDKQHPFGHGRWEQIAAIFIAFLLGVIAYGFIMDSIESFKSNETANFGTIAIVVTIVSVVVKEAMAQYAFFLGKKSGSSSVKADGWHHRTDALSSLVILGGIFLKDIFWWIDGAMGIIVSLMIFYAAYEIIKESIDKLLGEQPSDELIEQIKTIVENAYEKDLAPHHFHIHNYVNHQELTFHIKYDPHTEIEKAHAVATDIEEKIYRQLYIRSTIHIEPLGVDHEFD
jgi:cation diffusion facilitator family transporter